MKSVLLIPLVCALPLAAAAQTNPLLPGRPTDPSLSPAPAQSQAASPRPDVAGAPQIALTRVAIEGALTVPTPDLDAAWRPFVGRRLDGPAIRAVADAVSAAYRAHGLALYTVQVPEQNFAGGVLRLQVTEGHIEEVVLHGDTKGDLSLVKAYGARLAGETPLKRATLERYISLIRDIPGLTADIQLLQGATPGGVKLAVGLEQHRSEVTLGYSSRRRPLLGAGLVSVDWALNSLARQGDQLVLSAAASPDLQIYQAFGAGYSTPLGYDGARLQVSAGHLRTRPDSLPVKGRATTAGLALSYPVLRGYVDNLVVSGGLDGVNSDAAIFGRAPATEHTRVARLTAGWSHETPVQAASVRVGLSRGLEGLGANVDPLLARPDFSKVAIDARYNRQLGPRVVVRLHGAAQVTGDPLPSSEQFTLGGAGFGRAFDTSALLADEGRAASAELDWTRRKEANGPGFAGAYVFADAGEVERNRRPALAPASDHVSSAGIGARFALGPNAEIGIEAAKPLDTPLVQPKSAIRWSVSLAGRF